MQEDGDFEDLVRDALDALPPEFARRLWNVEVVVRREPSRRELEEVGLGPDETLFGLYTGVPLTERGADSSGSVPDVITIYRGPIERECGGDPDCLRRQVGDTVRHEVAHYFGISDERLVQLGRS